jgi:hypothetical protein
VVGDGRGLIWPQEVAQVAGELQAEQEGAARGEEVGAVALLQPKGGLGGQEGAAREAGAAKLVTVVGHVQLAVEPP